MIMVPRKSREMGTQWSSSDDEDNNNKMTMASADDIYEEEQMDEDNLTERLEQFYFNLPRPKQLKSQGLARIHQKKVNDFVISSLDTLVEVSKKAEEQALALKIQAEQRLQQRLKPKILDSKRFESADFTESRLKFPLDIYLQKMRSPWGEDIAMLEGNMKTKKVGYQPRTKVMKTLFPPKVITPNRKREVDKEDLVQDVRRKLQDVESHAMEQKISASRIKDIRRELSDFDLINRPTNFLHLEKNADDGNLSSNLSFGGISAKSHPPDPVMVGSQSARRIYARLPSLISEAAFQTVMDDGKFTPFPSHLLDSPKKAKAVGKLDRVLNVQDAIRDLQKMPESKNFEIDLDPKPDLASRYQDDSMFELNCLRELVDITEGSGWERGKEEL